MVVHVAPPSIVLAKYPFAPAAMATVLLPWDTELMLPLVPLTPFDQLVPPFKV